MISVDGTHLPLPPRLSTRAPVVTAAASLLCPSARVGGSDLCRPLYSSFRGPVGPPSAPDLSLLLRLQSGTACRKRSVLHRL